MIEKMLKSTIICRQQDRNETLKELRELGILHVDQTLKNSSNEIAEIEQKINKIKQALFILSDLHKKNKVHKSNAQASESSINKLLELIDRNTEFEKEIDLCNREREKLLPWGNFSFKTIDELSEKGLFVYLCACNKEEFKKISADKTRTLEIINEDKNNIFFIVFSEHTIDKSELPLAQLPNEKKSLCEIDNRILELTKKLDETTNSLVSLSESINEIKRYEEYLEEKLEFLKNKNLMGEDKELSYIQGYTPSKTRKKLANAAEKNGWAVLQQEPAKMDRVPTLISIPKIFRLVRPIFDFVGLAPGYHEWDVSICFLFFFTIFFAMIVGDAGYGLLFLSVAVILKVLLRKQPKYKLPLNLFLLLSIATIAWGALTCSFFGLPTEVMPKWLRGSKLLTDPQMKDKYVQYICFFLAALHLSFARVWRAFIFRKTLKSLGELGWAMFIWGNFFTAVKLIVFSNSPFPVFAFYLYIIGFILIIAFYVRWNDVGSVFNIPFAFIGSFSDVLSYIRLFAVGMASYYIASSFNNMGHMIYQASPYFILLVIVVLLFGHLLNIALAFMGVLVHGLRLNALEFSNQMELEWSGVAYKPFEQKNNIISNNSNNKKSNK